ncbi:MAG: hypothetical protein K2Y39_01085 [Candidatus Obscuribacterales bacterium]|nr:hypothetical protein [Candidatus Obscuribacterales bacterium]
MDEKTSDFLEQLSNKYRHCDSYQDSGLIQTTTMVADRVIKSHNSFSTFFVRPGRLSIHIWFGEDQSGEPISIIYETGKVIAFRDGAGIPAMECHSLSNALAKACAVSNWTSDGFVLAVPALLEKELRDSCVSNFFDARCFLIKEVDSKAHLRRTIDSVTTDIWFRPDLTVHDVEVQSQMSKDEFLDQHATIIALPEIRETIERARQSYPNITEIVKEQSGKVTRKSRRVYSHVLFDGDIDESVFEFPAQ